MRANAVGTSDQAPIDTLTLSYEDRYRRRVALTADNGTQFLLDLPETTDLQDGDALLLDTGDVIRVKAAPEALMKAEPRKLSDLAQICWHIGNRHLPCEIHTDHVLLREDHVIAHMLEHLNCAVTKVTAPFNPGKGAYGQGRTHGHDHGHGQDHSHSHGHSHD